MSFVENLARAALGMAVLIGICYLLSKRRKYINWRTVFLALAMQVAFALLVLGVPIVNTAFDWIAKMFVAVLNYAQYGSEFLFGSLVTNTQSFGFIFAFQVLPTIIFFSAISSLLYYVGILQIVVKGMAWVMAKTLRLSGRIDFFQTHMKPKIRHECFQIVRTSFPDEKEWPHRILSSLWACDIKNPMNSDVFSFSPVTRMCNVLINALHRDI